MKVICVSYRSPDSVPCVESLAPRKTLFRVMMARPSSGAHKGEEGPWVPFWGQSASAKGAKLRAWSRAKLISTCAFFSRSDIGVQQSGMSLSNSKVMMTKASVEPLNCSSWWPAIQCCSCLVRDATWREGFLWGSSSFTWGQPRTTRPWNWRPWFLTLEQKTPYFSFINDQKCKQFKNFHQGTSNVVQPFSFPFMPPQGAWVMASQGA